MNIHELKEKPLWQMTGEEFLFLQQNSEHKETQPVTLNDTSKRYVYGISGIARLFGCSIPTANRIKQSGKIDKAITQIGRKIIVEADLALELAGRKQGRAQVMEAQVKTGGVPTLSQLWENSRLFVTDEFLQPPVILRVEDSIIGTLGNFSASTGKAKSKKTFNVCAIVAAALRNSLILNYSASLPQGKRRILYADTEQSKFHCQRVLRRILQLSQLPTGSQPDTLEFLSLRRYSPKTRLGIIEEAIYHSEGLGLVIIDGVRDLAYDINSPAEATELITKLTQWTEERQVHIHTVLHLNKGDDNTRGHLGTELNNKAETVLQITKDELDRNISSVTSSYIRDIDFDPFAFRINSNGLPELLDDYQPKQSVSQKGFDYREVPEAKHREALAILFSEAEQVSYSSLIGKLQKSYALAGFSFGTNKAKLLKVFLENKRMILKEDKCYRFNPDFHY